MGRQKKWYVVIVGRDVGVFQTWIDVAPLVTGVSGAVHQSFSSEIEAERIFAQALTEGKVEIVGSHAAPAAASPPRPNPSPRWHAETFGDDLELCRSEPPLSANLHRDFATPSYERENICVPVSNYLFSSYRCNTDSNPAFWQ
ncbi:hypothetical protein C8R45DRAFT_1093499 [Mycena sanguinolenta]|nr:hypothetical protein C8R45DRAFT_1093499 [Mycena sanguinolenta]